MHGLRIRYWDRNQDLDGKVKILILILMMPRFVNGGGMPVVPVVPLSKYLAPPILPRGAAAASARGKRQEGMLERFTTAGKAKCFPASG